MARLFKLDVAGAPPYYLHHRSKLGEFWLSSDASIPTFQYLPWISDQIPEAEREAFNRIVWTIGGSIVFPAELVDGKMTINAQQAFHPRIKDRFDLTLECIRRHYLDEPSPLAPVLARDADFFALFVDFASYVDFFHLQDLVNKGARRSRSSRRLRTSRARRCCRRSAGRPRPAAPLRAV